jgi:hypothetical protein
MNERPHASYYYRAAHPALICVFISWENNKLYSNLYDYTDQYDACTILYFRDGKKGDRKLSCGSEGKWPLLVL